MISLIDKIKNGEMFVDIEYYEHIPKLRKIFDIELSDTAPYLYFENGRLSDKTNLYFSGIPMIPSSKIIQEYELLREIEDMENGELVLESDWNDKQIKIAWKGEH
ncbi:hypothetical protein [Filifactor alocis]|uniref:hypothetical protein n=1 Tax=Filifactor alocis TaxID=143361 RepID=UPI003FA019C4